MSVLKTLTAAVLLPPACDLYSIVIALACIGGQSLAQHLFVPIIQADIIHTAIKEELWVHFAMTLLKQSFLSCESATERLSLIALQPAFVTARAVLLTYIAGSVFVLVRCLPPFAPFYHRGDCFTSSVEALVGTVTVEVPTQAAHAVVVAARQFDDQVPLPLVGDDQAKVCQQHCTPPPLEQRHLTLTQFHRKIQKLPIHLEGKENVHNTNHDRIFRHFRLQTKSLP